MRRESVFKVLQQRWMRSHEEDTETETVFRPTTFDFPPARGRTGFELRPDRTVVEIGIGPTDRSEETQGTWELVGESHFDIRITSQSRLRRVLHVAFVNKDRLVIKK